MRRPLIANARYLFDKRGMLPIYLIFGVTYRCNAACLTCFNGKYLNDKGLMARELSIDEIDRMSRTLGPLVWLLFTGGEPVMRPDLVAVAERFYRNNRLRNLTVPSGGILTHRIVEVAQGILERCPGLKLVFSFSLDGLEERHDQLRGFPGNFRRLVETLPALRDLQRRYRALSINLNTVVSTRNLDQVEPIMEWVRREWPWVGFHGFELLRGEPLDPSLKTPAYAEYLPIFEKIKEYWRGFPFYAMPLARGLKAAKIHARQIEMEVLRTGRMVFDCHAGSISAHIDPVGNVSLCELTHRVANLRDHAMDFPSVWFSDRAEQLRERVRAKECACTHSCFVSSSILFTPREYPHLARLAWRYR